MNKTTKRIFPSIVMAGSFALFVPVIASIATGCGGGQSASNVSRYASIKLSVDWPERSTSRLIPYAAESIKITITNSAGFVKSEVLSRPVANLTIGDLPPGELQIQAVAFPSANPTNDVPQATATQMVTAVADQVFTLALTLESNVDHVVIRSDVSKLRRGDETIVSASAYDISNRLVLTNPATWKWTSSDTGVFSVDASVQPIRLAATTKGTASIVAMEMESGKSVSQTIDVISPLPQLVFTAPDTERLVGQESVLSWTSTDAVSVVTSNFGATMASGNIAVSPKATTIYALKVANDISEAIEKSVTVRVATVGVSVTPASAVVDIGKSLQLNASVSGAVNTGVQWSVIDTNGGKVTASGLYTAPQTQGTFRVKAVSVADPSKSGFCDVRVRAAGGSIIIN